MNDVRRAQIWNIVDNIEDLKDRLKKLHVKTEENLMEEQAARDNMPDNLMDSENATNSDNACDALSQAMDDIQEAMDKIEDAIENLTQAAN